MKEQINPKQQNMQEEQCGLLYCQEMPMNLFFCHVPGVHKKVVFLLCGQTTGQSGQRKQVKANTTNINLAMCFLTFI